MSNSLWKRVVDAFVEEVALPPLEERLKERGIISCEEVAVFRRETSDKRVLIMKYLSCGGHELVKTVCELVEETGNSHLVDLVQERQQEKAKQYIREIVIQVGETETYKDLAKYWKFGNTFIACVENEHPISPSDRASAMKARASDVVEKWVNKEGGPEKADIGRLRNSVVEVSQESPFISPSLEDRVECLYHRQNDIMRIKEFFTSFHLEEQLCLILLLNGIGGIGKSELAKGYANQMKNFYKGIFHVNASSLPALIESVKEILFIWKQDKIRDLREAPAEEILSHFNCELKSKSRVLLVFDPADTLAELSNVNFPSSSPVHVVVCSRSATSPDWPEGLFVKKQFVEKFSPDNAAKFVGAISGVSLSCHDEAVRELVSGIIDGHPLGLFHAALQLKEYYEQGKTVNDYLDSVSGLTKSIKEKHGSVRSWLDHYRLSGIKGPLAKVLLLKCSSPFNLVIQDLKKVSDKDVKIIQEELKDQGFAFEAEAFDWGMKVLRETDPVMYVWEKDMERLQKVAPQSHTVLLYCSLFGSSEIPDYALIDCLKHNDIASGGMQEAISEVVSRGYLRKMSKRNRPSDYYTMHRLIQKTVRVRRFEDSSQYRKALKTLCKCLLSRLPSSEELIRFEGLTCPYLSDLQPHVDTVACGVPLREDFDVEEFGEFLARAQTIACVLREPQAAMTMCQLCEARAEAEGAHGKQLSALIDLALLHHGRRTAQGCAEFDRVLEKATQVKERAEQATSNFSMNNYNFVSVLACLRKTSPGCDAMGVSLSLFMIGLSHFRLLLPLMRNVPEAASEITSLERVLFESSSAGQRLKEKMQLQIQQLRVNPHTVVSSVMITVAEFIQDTAPEDLKDLLQQVLLFTETVLSQWKKLLLLSIRPLQSKRAAALYLWNWIQFLYLNGNAKPGKILCRAFLKFEETFLPHGHQDIGMSQQYLGMFHLLLGEVEEAVRPLENALRPLQPKTHPTLRCAELYTLLYMAHSVKHIERAQISLGKAKDYWESQCAGSGHLDDEYHLTDFIQYCSAVSKMARIFLKLKNFTKALSFCEEVVRSCRQRLDQWIKMLKSRFAMLTWLFSVQVMNIELLILHSKALIGNGRHETALGLLLSLDSGLHDFKSEGLFLDIALAEWHFCKSLCHLGLNATDLFRTCWNTALDMCATCLDGNLRVLNRTFLSLVSSLAESRISNVSTSLEVRQAIETLANIQGHANERHCSALETLSSAFSGRNENAAAKKYDKFSLKLKKVIQKRASDTAEIFPSIPFYLVSDYIEKEDLSSIPREALTHPLPVQDPTVSYTIEQIDDEEKLDRYLKSFQVTII